MPTDKKFDLWFKRRPADSSTLPFDDETVESFHKRKKKCDEVRAANRCLNGLNKEVRELIDTRLWATMYLNYFITRIHTTAAANIKFNDLPNMGNLSLEDKPLATPPPPPLKGKYEPPFHKESLELQVQILKQRSKDARIGVDAIWATLNNLINTLTSEIDKTPPDSCIGFRVFNDQSQARLFPTGDIRCGNWQEFDIGQELIRQGAEDHITQVGKPTNYISISTSPRRLWNLICKWDPTGQRIAVIDLRVLQRLGIAYGSTTDDLGFINTGLKRTKYATKHHVLVLGWIPRRSVLGFISSETFEELLEEAQNDTSTERRNTPAVEYDKSISFQQISRRFNTTTKRIMKKAP